MRTLAVTDAVSSSKKISIIGAGPGGLFLAILLRQQRPQWQLSVWERNAPDATFGFGVVFSDRTVELLDRADPTSMATISKDFQSWTDIEVGTTKGVRRTGGHGFSAIARHQLLKILQQRAQELGIDVRYECEAIDFGALYASSDLLVGADGINSQVRAHWSAQFNPDIRMGQARFIWFATPRRYDALTFHFVQTPYGPFSTHAYPFSDDLSTFIVEADAETWHRAGLDRDGLPELGIGETDEAAMRFCEEIFAESLQGQPLVGNASQWRQFPTVRNASWTAADKVVILGDAAHTAHFSVGSGTKMAMEDATALTEVLITHDDPRGALLEYERMRRPSVEKIQHLAEPSRGWWENFQHWIDRDIDAFAVNFLTRTGRETVNHLSKRDPQFAQGTVDFCLLDRPITLSRDIHLTHRLALSLSGGSSQVDRVLKALRDSVLPPALLVAPDSREAQLDKIRLMLGDKCPPIAAPAANADLPIVKPGCLVGNDLFATTLATPGSIDDIEGWDAFVADAEQAVASGAALLIIEPACSQFDRRALAVHAAVTLRPRVSTPIAIAGCASDQEALTHLNADRADILVGEVSPRYFRDAHQLLGLEALVQPEGVVVVGASMDEAKAGNALLRNLQAFDGPVYGLGRSAGQAHGRRILTSLDDISDPLDLAILAVPSSAVPTALEDVARRGIRAAIICSGGFRETGSKEGYELQEAVDRIRERTGIRILGPNTSGLADPGIHLYASFVPAVTELRSGPVAVLAQSGGVAHAAALALEAEGIGVAAMIGVGNGCDVDLPELVHAMARSEGCGLIAIHLEGTSHGPELLQAIRETSETIPIVVLKSGVSDVDRLSVSHTGALTGNWVVAEALLTEAGAVVVSTLGELIDAAACLSLTRLSGCDSSREVGVGVVTGQAGPGILLTDRLQTLGISVPLLGCATEEQLVALLPALTHRQNPVDTGRPTNSFVGVLEVVAQDPLIDLLTVYMLLEPDAVDLAATLKEAADGCGIPIIAASNGIVSDLLPVHDELRSRGIPLLMNPERAAVGAWALVSDLRAAIRRNSRGQVIPASQPQDFGPIPSTEYEAKDILRNAQIPIPMSRLCSDRSQAHQAFVDLRDHTGAVVVKVASSEVGHKSARGGVHLGITDVEQLENALNCIDAIERTDTGYLVETQVVEGTDLFVAVRHDPSWGAMGLLGLGGTDVEERGAVEIFALPTSESVIRERLATILPEPVEAAAAVLAVYRLLDSALSTWPHASVFEINPLRITAHGAIALDALVSSD